LKSDDLISTEAVLKQVGQQIVNYRKKNKLTQAGLAEKALVSKRTIERLEAGQSIQMTNFISVLRVFDLLDILSLEKTPEIPVSRKASTKKKKLPPDHSQDWEKPSAPEVDLELPGSKSHNWGYEG